MDARLPCLDAIRGIAISMVVVWHIYRPAIIREVPWLEGPASILWSGVDLFFALSGFLIGSILLKTTNSPAYFRTFYARRAIRILPLYAALLVLMIVTGIDQSIWPMLLFVQNFEMAANNAFAHNLVVVTWSLAVEEQFYLLLPCLVLFAPARLLPRIIIGLIVAAPFIRLTMHLTGYSLATYVLLPSRMDTLLIGVLLAWILRDEDRAAIIRKRRSALLALCAVFASGYMAMALADLTFDSLIVATLGYSWTGVFFGLVLAVVLTSSRRMPTALRPLAWLGVGAYSIFLFHIPLAYVTWHLPAFAYPALLMLLSAASWWSIERPMIVLGRRLFTYRAQPQHILAPLG